MEIRNGNFSVYMHNELEATYRLRHGDIEFTLFTFKAIPPLFQVTNWFHGFPIPTHQDATVILHSDEQGLEFLMWMLELPEL